VTEWNSSTGTSHAHFNPCLRRCSIMRRNLRETETRLEFLKWNPVGALYFRHGFQVVSEGETHFLCRPGFAQLRKSRASGSPLNGRF